MRTTTIRAATAAAAYIGGGTDPLDFADGANWACTNVFGFALPPDSVPTADTDVIVAGTTAFAVANGSAFACKSIKFDNATFADGADMRGLDITKVTADSTIDLHGRTLRLAGANGAAAAYSYSTSRLQIYGTFTPQNVRGLNMTMMDGSTLNLARLTGAFNCAFTNPRYDSSTPMNCNLNFSSTDETENGKVDVKVALGDRTKEELKTIINGDGLIVKWSSEPAANVEFSVDDATRERGYKVKRVEGGLKLLRVNSFTIIVR